MSYFTETFEGILEFKGDAELAYAKRRTDERMTHDHKYGKYAAQYAKDNVNNNKHDRSAKDKADFENKKNDRERSVAKKKAEDEAKMRAKADSKFDAKQYASDRKDKAKSNYNKVKGKLQRESFDPVYNDLVNMGIID